MGSHSYLESGKRLYGILNTEKENQDNRYGRIPSKLYATLFWLLGTTPLFGMPRAIVD
jgi:hypothetical protein